MKVLSAALLLMASVAFVLVGCSDNASMPISPTDQSVQGSGLLAKQTVVNYVMYNFPVPPFPDGTGLRQTPGGIWQLNDVEVHEAVMIKYEDGTTETGDMTHYLSGTIGAEGEGPVHGKYTLTLASGGVWNGIYEGYRSYAPPAPALPPDFSLPAYLPPYQAYVFELPMKVVAHGTGGNIDGKKLTGMCVIRAYGTPPAAWYGISVGSYQ